MMSPEDTIRLFLEKGSFKKTDRILHLFKKNYTSKEIEDSVLNHLHSTIRSNSTFTETIHPANYTGNNPVVAKIAGCFSIAKLSSVEMALVHGSISSSEEIKYSDFDGVLFIDERKLTDAGQLHQLRELISRTEQMMFEQDALQHHGWKVLLHRDFSDYPDAEFPLELIRTGKVIYANTTQPVRVNVISTHQQYKEGFKRILKSIKKKCRKHPGDLFAFKILCSEIMLLPALFLQAKHNKTVSKKDSFGLLKTTCATIDQTIIDEVTMMRERWEQPSMNFTLSAFHNLRKSGMYLSALAPSIPKEISSRITNEWYARVNLLCEHLAAVQDVHHGE